MAWPAVAQAPDRPPSTSPSVPLTKSCEAPMAEVAALAPLPRTVEKLKARGELRVLAIGSSSTAGVGASSPKKSYPAQLESILERVFKGLEVVIINRGVSGEVAAATAERLKAQVALEKPDLVLWQVGTNDALARVPVEDFAQSVTDTIRWLKEFGVDVVLVGLQYTPRVARDEYYASIRAALHKIALAENVLLVRRFEAMKFLEHDHAGELLSGDGLHLNDLGYLCMAEHVARAVVVSAFIKALMAPGPPKDE